MEESNHRSGPVEKMLRAEGPNVQDLDDINKLCDIIRQTSFEIHKFFRSGHLEKICENALAHRLTSWEFKSHNSTHWTFSMRTKPC